MFKNYYVKYTLKITFIYVTHNNILCKNLHYTQYCSLQHNKIIRGITLKVFVSIVTLYLIVNLKLNLYKFSIKKLHNSLLTYISYLTIRFGVSINDR